MRLPRSRSSSDVAKPTGEQTWFRIQRRLEFAHSRSGFQPTVENLPKGCHGSGRCFGGCLQWISWSHIQKKNPPKKSARKSASQKQKIRRRTIPPKSTSQAQKIGRKTYRQIHLSNLQVTRGVFSDWEGLLLEASSEHGFWDNHWLLSGHGWGSHAEMHLQPLSCCWWEGQGLLHTLPESRQHFSQKRSFCGYGPKIHHTTLPTLAAQPTSMKSVWDVVFQHHLTSKHPFVDAKKSERNNTITKCHQ